MPKTIPCWECKGLGCEFCHGNGVLSVYTSYEVQELMEKIRVSKHHMIIDKCRSLSARLKISLKDDELRTCVHCGKPLPGKKRKYCSDFCRYWYLSIKNDKFSTGSKSQQLRMNRAARGERKRGNMYM